MSVRGIIPQIGKITDANGDPVAGAKAYFYQTGTTSPVTVYADAAATTPHPSPLVADSAGILPAFFITGSSEVKIDVFTDADVQVAGYPIDPVVGVVATARSASDITFTPTTNIDDTNVQDAVAQIGKSLTESPESYDAVGDGAADDTTELTNFLTARAGGVAVFGAGKNYLISSQLSVAADTTVDLNGSTITLASGASRAFLVAGSNVTIKNGKIDCAYLGTGITASNDKGYLKVEDIEVLNPTTTGIAATNCSYSCFRRCRVHWDATGVAARVSAGNALYGITVLVTTNGYVVKEPKVIDCEVDFTAFTASQMESVDACILMRGDEVGGTFTNMLNPVARHNRMYMPEGVRDTTYGSGLPRPTGIEIRTASDMQCNHNLTEGGDLTNTFGRITRGTAVGNHANGQTHYCMEIAQDCRDMTIVAPNLFSSLGLQLLSITDCAGFSVVGGIIQGGDTTDSDCVRVSGADTVGVVSGMRIVPAASGGSDGVDVAGAKEVRISDCVHFGSSSGGAHIHTSSGTTASLSVIGCSFEGGSVRPLDIDAGSTVSHLRVGLCDGIGTPLGSDLVSGTITASTYTANQNLTGL